MIAHIPNDLLDRFSKAEYSAVEQIYRIYQPFLDRVVERRLPPGLRSKFDPGDVVQSVWSEVLTRFRRGRPAFTDPRHLHAYLVRATRHRFIDRLRQYRHALEQEHPFGDLETHQMPGAEPSPCDAVQADELWHRLLALCPQEHHSVLHLRRQGSTLGEIADRTGLHIDSVRRILRQLHRRWCANESWSPVS